MNKVLVTGAGVDKTEGINFPLANSLLSEMTKFIANEGAEFDRLLRQGIPHLRFTFNKFVSQEIDALTSKDIPQLRKIVEAVEDVVRTIDDENDISRKKGQIIVTLFNKLVAVQRESEIDDATYGLIREVFGEAFTESDFVVDIHKMSLSDTFKSILRVTLRESLEGAESPLSDAMAGEMLNIEQLLIQKFLGFYNQRPADMKNYVYIAWSLWAFLVSRQKAVLGKFEGRDLPYYGQLPADVKAITLNYTNFLRVSPVGSVIHFHGDLAEFVRMDTRDLMPIQNIEEVDICEFARNLLLPNLVFDSEHVDNDVHVIPSMVPPLRLKPILSQKYIELWADAAKVLHQAERVVIMGYSFNSADEHFNDLVRNGGQAEYVIVAPDATKDHFLVRMEKVFGINRNQLIRVQIQEHTAMKVQNLILVSARADQVDVNGLFEMQL